MIIPLLQSTNHTHRHRRIAKSNEKRNAAPVNRILARFLSKSQFRGEFRFVALILIMQLPCAHAESDYGIALALHPVVVVERGAGPGYLFTATLASISITTLIGIPDPLFSNEYSHTLLLPSCSDFNSDMSGIYTYSMKQHMRRRANGRNLNHSRLLKRLQSVVQCAAKQESDLSVPYGEGRCAFLRGDGGQVARCGAERDVLLFVRGGHCEDV
jgi:hypothetical protein